MWWIGREAASSMAATLERLFRAVEPSATQRRSIDPSGRVTWVTNIQRGARVEQIIGGIVASEEYFNKR